MTKQVRGTKNPITLRRVLPIAAVLFLFALVFVAPAAAGQITEALDLTSKTGDESGDGWSWSVDSKTLTLSGLDLVVDTTPAIKVPAGTTIILAGGSDNKITTSANGGRGIESAGDLTVKTADGAATKGSLTIKAETGNSYGIVLVGEPTDTSVTFSFSNVNLDITARRGIQMTTDKGQFERQYSIGLEAVTYKFTGKASDYRSLQAWNDKGDATITLKKSTLNGDGDVYVCGKGANSKTTTNILNSKLTITGSVFANCGDEVITTIEGSTVNAKQIKVLHWQEWNINNDQPLTLAKLDVTSSTLNVGPTGENNAAIEVGSNSAKTAVANLKDSTIIAVNDAKSAISVSRWMDATERSQYENQEAWTQAARGTVNVDNCNMLLAGSKYYGDIETGTVTGSDYTNVVYDYTAGMITTKDDGTKEIDFPADTKITSGGETYTIIKEEETEEPTDTILTVKTDGSMAVPENTVLKRDDGNKIESEGKITFTPDQGVTLPAGVETTITPPPESKGDEIKITPTESAPLKMDDNGNIEISTGATVQIGAGEAITITPPKTEGESLKVDTTTGNIEIPAGSEVQIGEEKQVIENGGLLTGDVLYTIGTIEAQTYNGTALEPEITVKKNGAPFADFTVTYENNIKVGTAAMAIVKVGDTEIGKQNFEIKAKDISGAEITLVSENLICTGEPLSPTITSVIIDELIVTEYTVSDNVKTAAGTYTLKVTGNGNFTGTATKEWSIQEPVQGGEVTEEERNTLEQEINGEFKTLFEGKTVFYVDIVLLGANGQPDHTTPITFTVNYPQDSGITATNFGNYKFVVLHYNETTSLVEQVQNINPTANGLEIFSTVSPFAIGYSVIQSGGSSTPQGSSVWLQEPLTPTPTETPSEQPTDVAPTDVPTTQPTATETQTPGFGVLAVLGALGAVAVLRRK